jgi:poly(hydroxyalkanoate) depolymerase family esterase
MSWRLQWSRQWARLAASGRALLRRLRPAPPTRATPADSRPAAYPGRFSEGHFGRNSPRRYMLYEPARRKTSDMPLLVLLHGCQQGAEDFAAGTRMNEAADAAGVLVLYPEQPRSAHAMRCWNWYALQDRSNSDGDAALIAAMTRHVTQTHGIDARRVYVAGMSAGGAMAAVLARDYPDVYAALGVHSGMPAGLAHDVVSAMRLMAGGPGPLPADELSRPAGLPVASIVFHGDEDTVVHPSNGEAIHAPPGPGDAAPEPPAGSLQATTGAADGQRGYTRSVDYGSGGVSRHELWIVHGAGHAWAGGSEAERHTDAEGPDASREMLRFFLQHRLAAPA